jgi:hypothetical protein
MMGSVAVNISNDSLQTSLWRLQTKLAALISPDT